jgi:hypothetical protein
MALPIRNLIGVLCACAWLVACSETDDALAIKTLLESGVKAAEQKSIDGLMELTTDDFVAMPGLRDESMVRKILFAAFMRYGKFTIHYPSPRIEIADNGVHAVVAFPFVIVRQNHDLPGLSGLYDDPQGWMEAVGEKADLYQLNLRLRKQDGDWLVAQAELRGYRHSVF